MPDVTLLDRLAAERAEDGSFAVDVALPPCFQPARKERAVEKQFEVPILVAAALVIPAIVVEQVAGEPWETMAFALNWAI